MTLRDYARSLGYQASPDIETDEGLLQSLVYQAQMARQADVYTRLGRQLAPHADRIRAAIGAQAAPAAPSAPSIWDRPEFDRKWAELVTLDEASGTYIPKPGVPDEIGHKINAFAAWANRYQDNPSGYIEHVAGPLIEKAIEAKLAQFEQLQQQSVAISDIQQANARWLYQYDSNGSVVTGFDGKPMPSPAGKSYLRHLSTVAQAGVTDARQQDRLARALVYQEVSSANGAQGQAAAARNGSPQFAHAQARPNVSPLAALSVADRGSLGGSAPDPSTTGLSLNDAIMRALAAEGITANNFSI
jgi:hypothetical protein